ncbi:MAG: DNA topoisomerase IV subunit B [Acidimicrobiaceae bacterium]|jgi:DNA gyrase subunit B|nr:DNA topoisomerase IV subunit B [Acidimicrobiaceae bacterium]
MASNSTYDAAAIQTLEGLEAVRKRPGMYIGGTGSQGLVHLVWELIDNGVDEAAGGFANKIEVIFHRDKSIEVIDNGRGIPIGKHPKHKVSALEVVLTELHAGGKFGGGAYGASGGLHGVGASVVNALSSRMTAEVDRDGYTWKLDFKDQKAGHFNGGRFKRGHDLEKLKKISKTKTGSRLRFWPDWDIFDPDAMIDYEIVRDRVARATFLVPGLKIKLVDKRTGQQQEDEFLSRGGLKDLVEYESKGDSVTKVITFNGIETFEEKVPVNGKMTTVERECTVDIAMRWVAGYDTSVSSFVNTVPTPDGGTHLNGFERALTRAINDKLLPGTKKLAKLAKQDKDRAVKDDVHEGLVAAIKVTFPEPQFRGQTKRELGTPAIQSIVYEVVKTQLTAWFEGEGPKSHVNALRDKVATAILNRMASRQTLENKRKAASLGSSGMPAKLADCRQHGINSELLVVEGDSAAGPAMAGRDSATMAILPLRGKVVNAAKATVKQVLDNSEAQALFTAVGAGSGEAFDLDSARYGRIVILCDADVDGSHIRCLLLTLMHKYMRPMLEAGRIYAAQPPLFTTKVNGENYRAFSDEEKESITAELSKGNRKAENIRWQRFKGLGEMNVDELASAALDPETRILKRLTMHDAEQAKDAAKMFDVLMGSNVEVRRDYIIKETALFDREALDV